RAEIKSQMPYYYTTGGPPTAGFNRVNTFEFYRLRWHFQALGRLRFPAGESGNVVRGAFGLLLRQTASSEVYARLFEPGRAGGVSPSGLRDWPRPFVFRTAAVDGREIAPGGAFHIDMHVFDARPELMGAIRATFEQLGEAGLGPGRGRAALSRVEQMGADESACEMAAMPGRPTVVSLDPEPAERAVRQVRLRFLTPTELKGGSGAEFGVLFARLRDRISTLRALYGAGPLEIDFRGLGERARAVELVSSALEWIGARRRSSRTGQTHPLGGFTGEAEYAGELGEFLPWLRAARWTGVGRQTVWGKGDVRVMGM
ncbi:MAG TPA: CRISPR system precrRNA processing endoribonuclease RAMP protein Cas6, partial [Bryobacteraceae bacterium]